MRAVLMLRAAAVAVLLATTVGAGAECNSALRSVSEPNNTPNRAAGPVASLGSVIAVAKTEAAARNAIYVATYDEVTLGTLSPDRLVSGSSLRGAFATVANSVDFGVFYQRTDENIIYQRVSFLGEVTGTPVVIAPNQVWPGQELDVIFDPVRNAYVMVRTVPRGFDAGLWLTVIRPDGTIVHNAQISARALSTTAHPSVAVTSNGTLGVVWSLANDETQALQFVAIGPDNATNFNSFTALSGTLTDGLIASNGTSFYVVARRDTGVAALRTLRSMRVSTTGAILQPDTLLVTPRGEDIVAKELVWNPTLREWALTYAEYSQAANAGYREARLLRIPQDTGAVSDSYLTPDLSSGYVLQVSESLIWSGNAYLATGVYTESVVRGSASSLMRHCPLVVTVTPSVRDVLYLRDVTYTATISGGQPEPDVTFEFSDFTEPQRGRSVTHRFLRPGTYSVVVTARDRAGSTSQTTFLVNAKENITPPPPPPPPPPPVSTRRRAARR